MDRSRAVPRSDDLARGAESGSPPRAEARRGELGLPAVRGRLKVFFGYAAGVGMTRSMLQAAPARIASGSRALLAGCPGGSGGLEPGSWPRGLERAGDGAGDGFDLDAALRCRPDLLLLPGLAHRNPATARHRWRYQDVEEVIEAGIDVWSTLEVGHLESLADLVERITRSPVENTVPDAVFDAADEVELIDLPPRELLDRLRRGAAPGGAGSAPDGPMLEPATLVALREIALRRAADRLNGRERNQREGGLRPAPACPTSERLLVCVGPSPSSVRVIRTASRMARSMHAPWIAVHVARDQGPPQGEEHGISRNLRLAATLGAETLILPGRNVPRVIVDRARARGITKILVGKTGRPGWRSWLKRSLVDQLIASSGEIDVYVIRGGSETGPRRGAAPERASRWLSAAAGTTVALGLATAVAGVFEALGLSEANLVLAYLLGVTAVAVGLGRGPAIFASFAAVLLFNFFFTSPHYTFRVHDSGYLFTFAVMLVIGVLVSTLTSRIRDQSVAARERERRTEQLYQLSQELSATTGPRQIVTAGAARLSALLDAEVSILLPDESGRLRPAGLASPRLARDPRLLPVATWVYEHARIAGAGTETHADAPAFCLPLTTPEGVAGVVAVEARNPHLLLLPDRRRLVDTFAALVAVALQRDHLTEQVHRTIAQAENERLRSAVLSSVSHDFRTPLAAITGASSSLLDAGERLDPEEQREMLRSIYEEADRLARLVDNLLHMTRLEAGQVEAKREWNLVEDLVGSALTRLAQPLAGREIVTRIPGQLPLIRVDGVLIELVLCNLLDNAAKYSPPGTPIEISARTGGAHFVVEVADRGPGLSAEEKARACEKFYRGPTRREDGSRGAGLGLAICAAIVRLHGGSLRVEDRAGGGASFLVGLPLEEQPPALAVHDPEHEGGGAP